jgi:Ca2+-binding RTX toxin-like protein
MGRHLKNYSINDQALALGIVNTSTANRPAGKNGQIIYNTTTGGLYYDADGNGGKAAVQIAILGTSPYPTMFYTDFAVIS